MLRDLLQQLSEWLTVSPSALHIQQMALSVCICTVAQKDNSSVCAWGDYSIPLLFILHSHANPGLLTLQSSKITLTHKKHKVTTHREHGKVSDHFKSEGRGQTSRIANISNRSIVCNMVISTITYTDVCQGLMSCSNLIPQCKLHSYWQKKALWHTNISSTQYVGRDSIAAQKKAQVYFKISTEYSPRTEDRFRSMH